MRITVAGGLFVLIGFLLGGRRFAVRTAFLACPVHPWREVGGLCSRRDGAGPILQILETGVSGPALGAVCQCLPIQYLNIELRPPPVASPAPNERLPDGGVQAERDGGHESWHGKEHRHTADVECDVDARNQRR